MPTPKVYTYIQFMTDIYDTSQEAVAGTPWSRSTKHQLASFGITGILNTAIDFTILNLCIFLLGLPVVPANIISVTIALLFSFTLNSRWVFSGHKASRLRQFGLFAVITLIGLYGFQTAIIHLFTTQLLWPAQQIIAILTVFGLKLPDDFVIANTAKILATFCTMVWNFVMYKKFVFKQ